MVQKKQSPPSSGSEKPPKTRRTRPLPAGIVSGFRRLAAFPNAALVATLAPLLDPGADGPLPSMDVPHLSRPQADALARLDAFAGATSAGRALFEVSHQRVDGPVAFMLALDIDDLVSRWRAVVSRAFARADAAAWCLAEGFEDDAALVDWAELTEKALDRIEPSWRDWQDHREAWHRGPVKERFDRAWRRRYFALGEDHDEMRDQLSAALETLAARAAAARRCAAETTEGGRTPATARNHFVLSLATTYALSTGDDAPFFGGDAGSRNNVGSRRKRLPNRWYDVLAAALELVGIGDRTSLDAILRAVGQTPHAFTVKGMGRMAATHGDPEIHRGWPSWLRSDLPMVGLEIDVGCDVSNPPTSRNDAYRAPSLLYRGRSGRG